MDYIVAKSIISEYRESNNWFGINYNMNIYKGCNHGCIYCDSRSKCYGINNFESVRAKENSLEIIRRELKSKRKNGVVGTGAMSDPYNPFEKRLSLTRSALEIIDNTGFGVAIATKSDLIIRDIDILTRIKKHSPVLCKITITTAEDDLCRKIEPNVVVTSKRFEAVKRLSENDIYTGILLMPILPFINDTQENIVSIIRLAKENGAKFIYPAFGVTLRSNQRDHFFDMIDKSFPKIKEKYIKSFGNDYMCNSPNARTLYKIFKNECERFGLLYKMNDIIDGYKNGYSNEQLRLFNI